MTWHGFIRLGLKTLLWIIAINAAFALLQPLQSLGRLSVYNHLVPGRERFPYGENPSESYSLSTNNLPAMFAAHLLSRPKTADEFRVLILGDSSVWGWLLPIDDTLTAVLNSYADPLPNGRRIVAYNLGYPIMSLLKDVLILREARAYQPDLIIWQVTLASFPREKQLFPPLVAANAPRVRDLISQHDLALDSMDTRLRDPDLWERTLIGSRREAADWLRLQFYGVAWGATRIDQALPAEFTPRQSDFEADLSWESFRQPTALTGDELAFDVLRAGIAEADNVPLLLINEPMFISSGTNSDLRYNSFYPRWAYDSYRELLAQSAVAMRVTYMDSWDAIAPSEFTDTPVHLSVSGTRAWAALVRSAILEMMHAAKTP